MNRLSVFFSGLAVVLCAHCLGEGVGCVQPAEAPSTASLVEKCKAEARAAFRDGGGIDEAAGVYDRCVADGGVSAR